MSLPNVIINYWGVVSAVVASFILGFLWYHPMLFGKKWIRLNGFSKAEIRKHHKDKMIGKMILMILGTTVSAIMLAYLVNVLTIGTFAQGVYLGVILAVGFILMTTLLGNVLWQRKPWALFILDGAYWIIDLALIGGIVAVWA